MIDTPDIAILCPGPSLAGFLYEPPAKHDVYVGVNRAVEAYPCDWWVFNDQRAMAAYQPLRSSTKPVLFIFSSHQAHALLANQGVIVFADYEWHFFEQSGTTCPRDTRWRMFSMLAAMILADKLNASRITVYGSDWQGHDDWDGPSPLGLEGRSADRWNNERHAYGHVCKWLLERGIPCNRSNDDVKIKEQQEKTVCYGRTGDRSGRDGRSIGT